MALLRLRLFFFIQIYDPKLFIGTLINKTRVPNTQMARKFLHRASWNDFLAGGRRSVRASRGAVHRASGPLGANLPDGI
jgi:hypothetical protein